ncbi:MAG: M56 family metallopeptidase, partial [Planctomycetota bacterium JB042]
MTVEVWNRLADGLLRWMLERGLVSACVLAVAFAAFLVLRARLRLTAPLFAAALVVLVLPLERLLPASLSVPAFARPVDLLADRIGPLPEVPAEAGPVEVVLTGDPAVERAPANAGPVHASATPGVRPTPGAWLALVWAAVAAALLGGLVRHQLRARRLVRSALPVDGPLADECARLARDIGVRRTVRCVESEELASPATWGVLRPVVALPLGLAATLAPAERRWILLHELHHVRRGDVLQQLGQRLLQIAWWFDPCVWLASRMVDRQRECLCDDDADRK